MDKEKKEEEEKIRINLDTYLKYDFLGYTVMFMFFQFIIPDL